MRDDDKLGVGAVITRACSYLCAHGLLVAPVSIPGFTTACLWGGGKGREIVRKAMTIKRLWLSRMCGTA